MKSTKRIVMLALAFVMLVTCAVSVIASAASGSVRVMFADIGLNKVGDSVRLDEYRKSIIFRDADMETGTLPYYIGGGDGDLLVGLERTVEGETNRRGAENIYNPSITTNGFITFDYGERSLADKTKTAPGGGWKNLELGSMTEPGKSVENGYVIEFDFGILSYIDNMGTSDDDTDDERVWDFPGWVDLDGVLQDGAMNIEFLTTTTATSKNSKGESLYTKLLFVEQNAQTPEEDYYFRINGGGKSRNIAADEWVHVTFIFNPEELTMSMYLGDDKTGRELVGVRELVEGLYPINFRVGGNCSCGQVSIDNILAYPGMKVHNPKYLNDLPTVERFIYLAGCAADTSLDSFRRYVAVSLAEELYEKHSSIREGTDIDVVYARAIYENVAQNETLMNELTENAKYYNSDNYVQMVNELAAIDRMLTNISVRTQKLEAIDAFYEYEMPVIDIESVEFINASSTLEAIRQDLVDDANTVKFVEAMERFLACRDLGFVDSMRQHFNSASELIEEIKDKDEEVEAILGDYVDDSPSSATSFYKRLVKVVNYYRSAEAELGEAEAVNNAKRFVDMVEILIERKDIWTTDGGTCERIWKTARDTVALGQFTDEVRAKVSGFDAAYYAFSNSVDGIDKFFWDRTQQGHIDILSARLAGYNVDGVTYISRNAIVQYVENYLITNSEMIDFDNPTIKEIQATNAAYKANLGYYAVDFAKLLNENEKRFLNLVTLMQQEDTYAGVMQYMEEATECYLMMNISENTMPVIAYFEELSERLDKVFVDCEIFKAAAAGLGKTDDDDEIYALLAEGFSCIENLDSTVEGVSDARVKYDKVYNEYMNIVSSSNSELSAATDVVSSVRAYCGIDGILAVADTVIK